MGDRMKHILQDNALESWAMAIKYSNFILKGKATLQYRKQFVSSLHNAVELFIKQLMLDNNDHRVCSVRKGCDACGHPAVEFYNAADLNSYFENLADEDMKKFYSIEFNEIQRLVKELFSGYYGEHSADKIVVDDSIALLGRLRNGETHFFVEKNSFLTDKEFQKLYNFMIVLNAILHYYNLLPYWGKPWGEFERFKVGETSLQNFSYKKAVQQSKFYQDLKEYISEGVYPANGNTAYDYAEDMYFYLRNKDKDMDFDELWTCVEMAVRYDLLSYEDVVEEYDEPEIGTGKNAYRVFKLK